jgi:glycosyltransferase involved in cell wall biosynthesis
MVSDKKIVHVIPYFQPSFGYEEYYHSLAHSQIGYDVTVVTSAFYNPNIFSGKRVKVAAHEDVGLPIKIVRLPSVEFPGMPQNILTGLKKCLAELKPRLLFLHSPEYFCHLLIPRVVKHQSCTIIDVHKDGTSQTQGGKALKVSIASFFKRAIRNVVVRLNVRDCNYVLFYAASHMHEFRSVHNLPRNIELMASFMPVNTATFFPSSQARQKFRARYGIKDEVLVVLSGRLVRDKRVSDLVRAFSEGSYEEAVLLLVGSCQLDYLNEIEHAAGPLWGGRIRQVPKVSSSELAGVYNAADIALWPFHMSVGVLEALACGVTVLTNSEAKSYYEALADEFIVDGSAEAFVSKINQLIDSQIFKDDGTRSRNANKTKELSYHALAQHTAGLCEDWTARKPT